ncbi:uncharacterized protein At1g76660-like isoform X1 [Actinidia eriantha]|uniref:uncharacterized protein At1g76660-like isoform X1 n=1 Tax=Actinidia eriantha TaxID=165200 RepID=UPI0025843229|nr:uncharacterized protein At1g76660-like isoform X1 [Actinidia eriantha]
MGSEQNRFPQEPAPRRKAWGGCWGGLSCFGTQKGGKRIVPASRIPETNSLANAPNAPQNVGLTNQTTTIAPSLLAPPSSPASFSNSALPSTAQSPSCFLSLSANSPEGGPSSTMFATGPYAHETQLVSPPVFSTFTTEPSTAPLTPPPELAHLTTPSSPDVPFAQFLSSSMDLKGTEKTNYINANDLQATYSLYPGSPASSLISPISRTSGGCLSSSFHEREFPPQWDPSISSQDTKYPKSESGRLTGPCTATASTLSQDSNFFCPATFAQFYLDHTPLPHSGGRLSVSKESDVYPNGGSGHQNRQNKTNKQDVEEIEAYRASFGFSADEIITTAQYVEISDVLEDSFTMTPFAANKQPIDGSLLPPSTNEGQKAKETHTNLPNQKNQSSEVDYVHGVVGIEVPGSGNNCEGHISWRQPGDVNGRSAPGSHILSDEDDIFSRMGTSKISRKYHMGLSSSDAEIDYRRGRSLRQGKGDFAWRD